MLKFAHFILGQDNEIRSNKIRRQESRKYQRDLRIETIKIQHNYLEEK
jgi:hypothetical protein